ncbi:thioredoxin family protein [Rhodobacter sp. NTK016B]|uniref:thioredoxin family protein n=1 Tax=Rhodobacter sp. NTK016B TaxID=2759676 RepID=UPI001A8CA2B2|nr:thioredoxin family protein [Rhodobacter sp. NTK016B]MBN8294261.1 thioredoxin family protein [Rhodobacter sp. NTK016B]
MFRRDFLMLTAAASLMPLGAQAQFVPYAPGLAEDAMQRGDRIILDFYATWCSTCARQQRVMEELRAQNPAYDQNLTLIHVDWDDYGDSELSRRFNVPRRSTIIALKGERELGRTVAGTSVSDIRALFDLALTA